MVPITSNVQRVYPFQVRLSATESGLAHDSKAQAEPVRSIAVERIGELIGEVPAASMARVDEAFRLHLALQCYRRTTPTPEKAVKSASWVQTAAPWTRAVAAIQVSCMRGFRPAPSSEAASRA